MPSDSTTSTDPNFTDGGETPETAAPPRRRRAARRPVSSAEPEQAAEAVAAADPVPPAPPTRRRTARKSVSAAAQATPDIAEGLTATDLIPAGGDAPDLIDAAAEIGDTDPPAAFPAHASRPRAVVAPLFQAVDPALRPAVATAEAGGDLDPVDVGIETDLDSQDDDEGPPRRRRRGRRGRGRNRPEATDENTEDPDDGAVAEGVVAEDLDADPAEGESSDQNESGEPGSGSRRRRRRSRGGSGGGAAPMPDDPPNTVVKVREPRPRRGSTPDAEGVRGVHGSTRLEAKRQRRRDGRGVSRRAPIITEAEFLARRESVERHMVVRNQGERTQIAVLEDGVLVEHYVTQASSTAFAGNVYVGRVQNVLPSMEAAFVDIGKGRNAVLYAGEVNYDAAGFEGNRPRTIEQALKSGQSVLVQVSKDPIGHKGARLTSQVTLPGRYLVFVPEGSMTGISRKLPDTERARLKSILKKVVPEEAGVIVRTAAEGASEEDLTRDIERLAAQWETIKKAAAKAEKKAPALVHAEPNLVVRVIRDVFNEDFASLTVQGDDEWAQIEAYVSAVAPELMSRVSRWTGAQDVFSENRVDEQLIKALDRKVHLPSGGSLVIDRTEAMTVVDVNTGKFTGQGGNLEETVTRNNLEAAEEIVRQLRLRDVGGIIVIDFIDMVLESNRELVLRRLTECLGRDRTRHQVAEVTSLGLVQMTRKRVGSGLLEAYSEPCLTCNGRGVLIHFDGPPVHQHPAAPPAPVMPARPIPRPPQRRPTGEQLAGTQPAEPDTTPPAAAQPPVVEDAVEPVIEPVAAPRRRRRATSGGTVSAASAESASAL